MTEQVPDDFRRALEAFQRGDLDAVRDAAEAALASQPSPMWKHLLGLTYCRLGNAAAGVEHLKDAAEAEPANVPFQVMLARALTDSGRAAEVLQMPEPPPITSAATLALWQARGEAAEAAQEPDAAIEAWSKVAAAAPRDARAWNSLGNIFAALGRWPEAIDALMRAVKLNSGELAIRRNLAAAFAAADRHEEAIAALEDVEELGGASRDTAIAMAKSLVVLTRFSQAVEQYRRALDFAPGDAEAIHELGLTYERTNQLDSLPALLAEAAEQRVPEEKLAYLKAVLALREGKLDEASRALSAADRDEDPLRWYRLKSRIADRKGDTDEAFEAMVAMNRSTRDFDRWRERGAEYRERLRRLAQRMVADAADLPRLDAPERRMPAFLVGFPRSGTTLLDTFLMGHPQTEVLEEVHLLGAAEMQIGRVAELANRSRADLARARAAYFAEMDAHVDPAFEGLVIDKLPLNMMGAPFIQALFPGSRILFAQRHPCDAVLSAFMQSFVMNDAMASFLTIEDSADLYDAVMSGWTAIRDAIDVPVHTVVYEQLVSDPEASLRPAVEFLGLPWDEKVLQHRETAKARGAIITPSYDQVTEPLTTRASGRWKRYSKQLEPVLDVLLPWAERLGYRN